jgi:ABC-2 type transport system permease protein
MLGLLMFNQFGSDGSGFWLVLQTVGGPADMLAELRGRTLAVAVVGVPFTVLVVVLSAAVLDEWSSLPDALGLALAVLGGLFGIGALTSVHLPYSVPQDNPMRNVAPGQGGLAWSSVLAGGLGAAVLCAPVIALTLWLNGSDSAWSWTVLPVGAAWGALLVWAGLRTAAHRGAARLPEILTAVRAG